MMNPPELSLALTDEGGWVEVWGRVLVVGRVEGAWGCGDGWVWGEGENSRNDRKMHYLWFRTCLCDAPQAQAPPKAAVRSVPPPPLPLLPALVPPVQPPQAQAAPWVPPKPPRRPLRTPPKQPEKAVVSCPFVVCLPRIEFACEITACIIHAMHILSKFTISCLSYYYC